MTVRFREFGVAGALLDDELLRSGGDVVGILKSNPLVELVETCIVGVDGEGLVKTLVRGGSVWSGVNLRLKRRVNSSGL